MLNAGGKIISHETAVFQLFPQRVTSVLVFDITIFQVKVSISTDTSSDYQIPTLEA